MRDIRIRRLQSGNRPRVPIIFHYFTLAQLTKEVLVVCNDNELEVMALSLVDDAEVIVKGN
jgi:hypothetical protein